jgi:hypothetical protein
MDELHVSYSFDAQGLVTATIEESYELQSNEPPAMFAEISMAYRPWYQAPPQLEATVTTPSGQVLKLDPRTIAEGPLATNAEQFSDAKMVRAPLPGLTRGAKVSMKLTRRDLKPLRNVDDRGIAVVEAACRGREEPHPRRELQLQLKRFQVRHQLVRRAPHGLGPQIGQTHWFPPASGNALSAALIETGISSSTSG